MAQDRKDGKKFYFDEEATDAVSEGFDIIAKTVAITYGPRGRNVLIEKTYGRPVLTRDGVTVAKESYIEERDKNTPAQLMIEASETTNRIAGDGTTATVVLCHELYRLGLRKIKDDGANPMEVKQEIIRDSYKILDELEKMKWSLKKGQLKQVASVSSGDEALGELIAEAVETVGADGGLITEKAPITDVDRTYVNGYYLQQGFTAINSGKKELENPYIVISNKLISSKVDAIELLQRVGQLAHTEQGLPMDAPLKDPLRIAFFGEIEGEAYNLIVANISQGVFDGTITKTPPMGDMGVQYLEDLAIYCGGKAIANGESLIKIDDSYFGSADKVSCTNVDTTVFGGNSTAEDLDKRKADLKDRISKEEIDAIAEKLKDRLAKLENKIAVFRIGGATDTEREEKEFRIEDAIQASRAAASSGVVVGGGMTLLKLSETESIGVIFKQALQNVFKKLMENAALPSDTKLSEALRAPKGYGFNLRKGAELVDLIEEGILDPYLVVQETIKNASSTAADAVSIGAMITFIDREG